MNPENDDARNARGDLVLAAVLLAVAAIGFWSLSTNEATSSFDYGRDPGPGFLPKILLYALGVMALILGAMAIRRLRHTTAGSPEIRAMPLWRSLGLPMLLIASLLAYAAGSSTVGFVPSTIVFTAIWIVIVGVADSRRLTLASALIYALQAAGIVAAVYLLFVEFIGVPLP
jgi:Tripartite tricarboxylate transporter TctB family